MIRVASWNRADGGRWQSALPGLGQTLMVIALYRIATSVLDAQPVRLWSENRENSLGIDGRQPGFFETERNWTQSACPVVAGTHEWTVLDKQASSVRSRQEDIDGSFEILRAAQSSHNSKK